MYIRVLALFALAFLVLVTPSWAQINCGGDFPTPCSITNSFSPGTTSGTFDFSQGGYGIITLKFDTVLTSFTLTATLDATIDPIPVSEEFPAGTSCVQYATTGNPCVQYDFTGTALSGGPNGVPVKGVDYMGLITVTLNFNNSSAIQIPAFGHAPGDNNTAVYSENILTVYVDPSAPACANNGCEDPGMGGKTPGISSFTALNIPFSASLPSGGDSVCSLNAVSQNTTAGNNPIVEVSFKLVASDCTNGAPLRDKTATLSVATLVNGNVVFTTLVNGGDANKFHFDNKNGVNVQDINTNGLAPGTYYVTVISQDFTPITTTFTVPLNP